MRNNTKALITILLFLSILAVFFNSDTNQQTLSASGQPPYRYLFPIFMKQSGNPSSTSYYMTTLNSDLIYNLGCELGKRDLNLADAQDSVSVLNFGRPRCFEEGGFGANLFGFGPVTLNQINTAVKNFASGYYNCTGADNASNLVIGVGTSNNMQENYIGPCLTDKQVKNHGAAWSGLVRDINQWLVNQGMFHQVQVYGASNMELGWNTPNWTRTWISGFEQVSGNFYLNFGDAAGCPYEDRPTWSCRDPWTQEDVWYVSYGAPSALPLPLIYLTSGTHAKQWAFLSQYSVRQHGYRMDFTGVFTNWQACQQRPSGCAFIDNTPEQAYQQMIHELGKSPTTAQDLRWKTDIRWIMQSEISGIGGISGTDSADAPHPLQALSNEVSTALQQPGLSPAMENSLAGKQNTFQTMAEMVDTSRANPAAKDGLTPIAASSIDQQPFETGIIPSGEIPGRPYGVEINTVWQALTDHGYLQIAGGSAPGDNQRGAIYIILTAFDHSTFQSELVLAPEGCGPLTIYEESIQSILLESSEGCQFEFDVQDWTLSTMPD